MQKEHPSCGMFASHWWNSHFPLMGWWRSMGGRIEWVSLPARRLDVVFFESQKLWFHTLCLFGEDGADIFLLFG